MASELAIGWATHLGPVLDETLELLRHTGIRTLQAACAPELENAQGGERLRLALQPLGVEIATITLDFGGEDWSDVGAACRSMGLAPEETRAARLQVAQQTAAWAHGLGVRRLCMQLGRIPEKNAPASYAGLVAAVRALCDELAARQQVLAIETGTDRSPRLRRFFGAVDRPNLRVHFNPANLLRWGQEEVF